MTDPTTTDTIDPSLDLRAEILRLKRERNAILLCHYYQDEELQDLADELGDSLALARRAAQTDADVIVFCGVHFMAETAKILNPDKLVLLPDPKAGCSLSDRCPESDFRGFLARYDDPFVISYVNSSAAVKAMSDVICTSGNVLRIVERAPSDRTIVFAPDQHLGRFAAQKTGRELVLWPGSCEVHEIFSEKALVQLKCRHPEALVVAHPECQERVLRHADFIGSTQAMLAKIAAAPHEAFIVVTEPGVLHEMRKRAPGKRFFTVPNEAGCACNTCPHMRLNTLEKLYLCLRDRVPAIEMPPALRERAAKPLQRMLEWS
ncbi:MAG: quinolinate synthase NadA [Myxococcales bacterium]|jgi:quinolinate synthase|nr:quinolinate synthase NadA [Myxococcales bacterium]